MCAAEFPFIVVTQRSCRTKVGDGLDAAQQADDALRIALQEGVCTRGESL